MASPDDPAARLRAIVRVHVLTHAEHQQGSFIGNSEIRSLEPANRAIVVSKRDQQKRIFDRVVLDGVERGVFTTPYPKEATMALVTMCTAVAQWYRARRAPAARRDRRPLRRTRPGHARLPTATGAAAMTPAASLTAGAGRPLGCD